MKTIILSCTPSECEKIVNGDISILVRKKVPNETPFKVYIYCGKTHSENVLLIDKETKEAYFGDYRNGCCCDIDGYVDCFIADDNVIGEFICDKVDEYTAEFVNNGCYEDIRRVWLDDDGEEDFEIITSNDMDNPEDCELLKNSCLTYAELKKYIGENFHDIPFYGLHISDLKIYDKPKALSEFKKADCDCPFPYVHLPPCPNCDERDIKRPPINYIYVEE